MSSQLALITAVVGASTACNLAPAGFFLIVEAGVARARKLQDAEDWAAGALRRQSALARSRRMRRG